MKRLVITDTAPLYATPAYDAETADEALCGMVVEVLEEKEGFCRVRTHYRYEGFTPSVCLSSDGVENWVLMEKRYATAPFLDIMTQPKVQASRLGFVPRGGILALSGQEDQGWQPVALPDGRCGYVRSTHLAELPRPWHQAKEPDLRELIVQTALSYLGTQYRWGGKTPAGIDCSGLASMAYMLCGSLIYRDADLKDGFDLHEIPIEKINKGDLIFFPGHVVVYIGEGRYVHATGKDGSDGVVVNSFNPKDPLYREDLEAADKCVGSLF